MVTQTGESYKQSNRCCAFWVQSWGAASWLLWAGCGVVRSFHRSMWQVLKPSESRQRAECATVLWCPSDLRFLREANPYSWGLKPTSSMVCLWNCAELLKLDSGFYVQLSCPGQTFSRFSKMSMICKNVITIAPQDAGVLVEVWLLCACEICLFEEYDDEGKLTENNLFQRAFPNIITLGI